MLKVVQADQEMRTSRIAALRARHEEISTKIDGLRTRHKSISDFYLAELKKQKLRLKDMIEELANGDAHVGDVMRA